MAEELKNVARLLKLVITIGGAMLTVFHLEKIDYEVQRGGLLWKKGEHVQNYCYCRRI